ncbi:hypothetical protein Taro_020752 [Colocasia esculenta]|uniref:Uncharacterized protein n=1 Tax=Colocasia esculenta TaxID=4460 RepID=A0A843V300_COLES|nr:hypothetical protein [Colocasia esculenta]
MLGACVMRLWSHEVAPMFRELFCLGGCVLRCCFRIVFDSAGSAGVVFDLTLVVGRGVTLFPCFIVLYSRSSLPDGRGGGLFAMRCQRCELRLYHELRVAFLQVLGLFEFIAFLTGLNSNPSRSSDLWVAARPSGSLAGVREVRKGLSTDGYRQNSGLLDCVYLSTATRGLSTATHSPSYLGSAWSGCELQQSVAAVAGCACYERGCWFARVAVGFVFGLRICVGVSRRLKEPTCGVAFTGAGLWSAEPVEVSRLHWWDFVCSRGRVVCFASRTLRALPVGGLFADVLGCLALPNSDVLPGFASAHCACGVFGLVFLWLHSCCVSLSDHEDDLGEIEWCRWTLSYVSW